MKTLLISLFIPYLALALEVYTDIYELGKEPRRIILTVDPKLDGKKMQIDWENTRYHQPSDDMAQPFDFNALVKATRIDFAAGYEIAQQTKRPHWNKGDFFDQFAKPGVK